MTLAGALVTGVRRFGATTTLDNIKASRAFSTSGGGYIPLANGEASTYEGIYKTQVWVRVAVDRVVRSMSRLPLKVYVNPDDANSRERVREGPLADLIAQPWRGGRNLRPGTPSRFLQAIVYNVLIHGNMVFVKYRPGAGDTVTELIPSNAGYWNVRDVMLGGTTRTQMYVFNPGDGRPGMYFRPEEVVHFMWWAGGTSAWGVSPLEALRQTLLIEDATQRLTISSFENGVRQNGAFVADGKLDKDQIERLREALQSTYGGVDKAFRAMLLDGGMKWQTMAQTHQESELIELRKLTREEVAAAMQVSPPMIGILDRSTFNNIEELHLMEYQDVLDPWATLIEQTLMAELVADEPQMEGQYVEFDLNKVMRGDPNKRMEIATKVIGGPYMTANEYRATQNLPAIDGGNELWAPLNTTANKDVMP